MKPLADIFKVLIFLLGIIVLSFNALLYNSFEQQKNVISKMSDQQKIDSRDNSNKFKYQQDKIEHLRLDLEDARQQMKSHGEALAEQKSALDAQKDALLQEIEKRQKVENENQNIQTSLIDIKAEADAIKEDMKGWQKDYVAILAELEKKMDTSQYELKSLENNLKEINIPELKDTINSLKDDIEKITHPTDNSVTSAPPEPDKKIERVELQSQ